MTVVISRLYSDMGKAESVAASLFAAGFPESTVDVIVSGGDGDLPSRIASARVSRDSAQIYAQNLSMERGLLVVRAPFTPFGAARRAQEIVDAVASIDVGVKDPNRHIREQPKPELFVSVLRDHPRWFSPDFGPGMTRLTLSDAFGLPLIRRRRGAGRSVFSGGKRFLSGLRASKPRRLSVFRGGGMTISRFLMLPPVSRRK